MNARHRNLHSSVRHRNYAVVVFIIQATAQNVNSGLKHRYFSRMYHRDIWRERERSKEGLVLCLPCSCLAPIMR